MLPQGQARLLSGFRDACARLGLLAPRARVLAAVSGGGDSMALLHLLSELLPEGALAAVHVDHRARAGSARDAAFVRREARRLGVPCRVLRLRAWRKPPSEGDLREARYAALARLAGTHLATAHTADDQAETVLLRIVRGAGLAGLSGIPESRPLGRLRVVRPLLGASRAELRAYLDRRQVPFREDPTNRRLSTARNRVRLRVLPELERLNPRVREALVRLSARARELREAPGAGRRLRAEAWRRLHAAAAPGRTLEADHLEALERLLATGRGEVALPGPLSIRIGRGRLRTRRPHRG